MKPFFFVLFLFFQSFSISAQSQSQYLQYSKKIVQFSKPIKILSKHIDVDGNGFIELTNPKKQILRYRLLKHKLQVLHGDIAFQLFYYKNNYLQRIETFDTKGNLASERESKNEAAVNFIIDKPDLYLKKKKLIDAAEGNIDLKDDSDEKIIRLELFDDNNLPIREFQASYISSKTYWDYNVRKYWP
jgi:hypothetical protein